MENWKDIKGYEGLYQVSDKGNIRNIKRNSNLKPTPDADGYLRVSLSKNNKGKTFKVHRLVAEAFIPNPENKPTVDHINTIRTDNRVSNLRWFTKKEQITENVITSGRRRKKVLCITTGEIFDSAMDAVRHYNIKNKYGVSNAANPKNDIRTAGELPDGTRLE